MDAPAAKSSSRLLDPVARISEILFGLIMVLTFTGSLSVSSANRADTREMLIGAIGCNLAWGIVDAVMFLMSNLTERARTRMTMQAIRGAADAATGRRRLVESLAPEVAAALDESQIEVMRRRVAAMDDPPRGRLVSRDDVLGAIAVFLLVFLSTFPVVVPFIFMQQAHLALRASNGIAIVMLFWCGYSLGRHAGARPWLVGLSMVIVGAALAGLTLALGG